MKVPNDLRDKVAQLLFVRIGSNMNPPVFAHDEIDRVAEILSRFPLGGLVLFNGVFGETRDALLELQQASAYPLLVAADLERGAGQQLRGATVFPHAMALSTQPGTAVAAARDMGRITAREALSEGVNFVLGPVADLNSDPRNPIIGARAFGKDPHEVSELVSAYIEGCHSEGALVSPKHFPGHGNTPSDSHSEIPVIQGGFEEFERTDLMPFSAAIRAGSDAIMTAHAAYPGLDPSGRVATRSTEILQNILRSKLHFSGAVVSDSLLMDGIRKSYSSTASMAVDLIRVGQDVLLDVPDVQETLEAIVGAVTGGMLPVETVEGAFRRCWGLKNRLAQFHGDRWHLPRPALDADELDANRAVAEGIARAALTAEGAEASGISESSCLFVMFKPYRTNQDPDVEPLGRLVSERIGTEAFEMIDEEAGDEQLETIASRCRNVNQLVVAIAVRPAAWRRYGLSDRLTRFAERLIMSVPNTTLVVLGAPETVSDLTRPRTTLVAFSDVEASQQAVFDRLLD